MSWSLPDPVFVNCPFDDEYTETFRALIFAIRAFGFQPRSARVKVLLRERSSGRELWPGSTCNVLFSAQSLALDIDPKTLEPRADDADPRLKVDIVAHSMGGLITRGTMDPLTRST